MPEKSNSDWGRRPFYSFNCQFWIIEQQNGATINVEGAAEGGKSVARPGPRTNYQRRWHFLVICAKTRWLPPSVRFGSVLCGLNGDAGRPQPVSISFQFALNISQSLSHFVRTWTSTYPHPFFFVLPMGKKFPAIEASFSNIVVSIIIIISAARTVWMKS